MTYSTGNLFQQTHDKAMNEDCRIDNSREAEASIDKDSMHRLILKAMKELKVRCTFREIAKQAGKKDQQIWKRLSEMEKQGLIVPFGEKVDSETKRKCSTWMIKN